MTPNLCYSPSTSRNGRSDVAHEAQVPVSLITHHFGTKEELFKHVISRRSEDHIADILAELRQAQSGVGGKPITIDAFKFS